jgi:hypothetical protein
MDELRDIKPLMQIPDYSYYLFWGGVIILILLGIVVLFFLLKRYYKTKGLTQRQQDFASLKNLDWSNPKKSAYAVTLLGRRLCNDQRSQEIFSQILPMLEQYKYKKEVPSVDIETLKQYNLLVHVIDESL